MMPPEKGNGGFYRNPQTNGWEWVEADENGICIPSWTRIRNRRWDAEIEARKIDRWLIWLLWAIIFIGGFLPFVYMLIV